MKKYKFLFLIFILFVSCKHENPKPKVIKKSTPTVEIKKKVEINDSISDYINPKLGLYGFKFITDTARVELKMIKIYHEGRLFQTIKTNKSFENNQFSLIDWNFDGYKDISVIYNCGSGSCAYWIWNYSPKLKKFVYNSILSEVLGLEMDSVSKYIIFHYRGGFSEESADTSKYVNDKLVFLKGLSQERWNDKDGNTWVKKTRTKVVHGIERTSVDSMIILEVKK